MQVTKSRRLVAMLLAGLLSGLGSAAVQAQEITLRAISAWPDNNYFSMNFEKFVAKVNAEGKGLVQITYLGGGAKVMPPFEVANAVKNGVADMGNVAGGFYTTSLSESDALSLNTRTAQELRKNGAHEYINKIWNEKLNVQYLGRSVDGLPINIFLRKPITKPDLTGLRMRVIPLYRPFLESLNAQSLLQIPPGEGYTALERGLLCSNDPFCSMHQPESDLEKRYSHGAACHGCELIAETSCEIRNEFLDRALVSPTVSFDPETGDPSFWEFINA